MIPTGSTSAYRRQDLADLYERWIRAVDRGDMSEAREAFAALDQYVHAGEIPDDDGPDRVLVRVTKEGLR